NYALAALVSERKFFLTTTTTTSILTLSLHDALPIYIQAQLTGGALAVPFLLGKLGIGPAQVPVLVKDVFQGQGYGQGFIFEKVLDRKSTRLNSSHVKISYAVFCLKEKKSAGWRSCVT